jgi:hypothetical protein
MGLDLWPSIVALMKFGDKHLASEGRIPMLVLHRDCGGELDDRRICQKCGALVDVREARAERGPGGAPLPAATAAA